MDAQPSQPERPASLIAAPYIRAFLMRVLQEEREREAQHGAEAQAQEDQRREVERRAEELRACQKVAGGSLGPSGTLADCVSSAGELWSEGVCMGAVE